MTKQLKPALITSLGLLALGASTGCISHTETTYSEPPRARIAFASEKAGRVFYEALQSTPPSRRRTEKRTEVNLILTDIENRVVTGPNAMLNAGLPPTLLPGASLLRGFDARLAPSRFGGTGRTASPYPHRNPGASGGECFTIQQGGRIRRH